jgi:hypothetical protein
MKRNARGRQLAGRKRSTLRESTTVAPNRTHEIASCVVELALAVSVAGSRHAPEPAPGSADPIAARVRLASLLPHQVAPRRAPTCRGVDKSDPTQKTVSRRGALMVKGQEQTQDRECQVHPLLTFRIGVSGGSPLGGKHVRHELSRGQAAKVVEPGLNLGRIDFLFGVYRSVGRLAVHAHTTPR